MSSAVTEEMKRIAERTARNAIKTFVIPRFKTLRVRLRNVKEGAHHDHENLEEVLKRLVLLENVVLGGPAAPPAECKRETKYRVNNDTMKKIRAKGELSQCDLAILLDVSLTSICRWESGKNALSSKIITRIVVLRGMSCRQLKKSLEEKKSQMVQRNA